MPHPLVVNIHRDAFDVLIDRRSKWGNPFKIGHVNPGDDHVWTREEVVGLYESWVRLNHPEMIAEAKRELRGKRLGCHCAPLLCHGEFLARIANEE